MNYKEILNKYSISAKKSLGQNFLINDNILEKIVNFVDLSWKNIIEVWPWYWALTEKILSKNPNNLELVELDKKMVEILQDRIKNWELKIKNWELKINNIDVLKFLPSLDNYLVVANIPYYITSPILTHFFYNIKNKPSEMIILMQKDVADKILLKNWNKRSVLSLSCEIATDEIKEIVRVSAASFIPVPKVESTVLYFKLKNNLNIENSNKLLKIIKAWYSERRKKLYSNLLKSSLFSREELDKIFENNNFSQNIRAEELKIEDWKKMI